MYDGLEVKWDGNNFIGVLDADADEASEELQALFANLKGACWDVMPAEDFIAPSELSDIWPAGMTLDDAARGVARAAFEQDLFCGNRGDIEEALIQRLQSLIAEDEDFTPTGEQEAAISAR